MKKHLKELEDKIKNSYEQGVTLDEAEKLAGEFLFAQFEISAELKKADLDSRMRKSGLKAIRSALYKNIVSTSDKKPTEVSIVADLDSNEMVIGEQESFDKAEVDKADLERYYDICLNAHIFFRSISRGRFE